MKSNKLPNFIIAGFPKCGSTSLFYYLKEHPQIYMPDQKELHYFTNEILLSLDNGPGDKEVNRFHISNLDNYKKCYSNVKDELAIGEASPSYINYASCISEIKAVLGENVKVLVLLRDPIKRAYSNYLHLKRENRENLSFSDALKEEDNRKELNYSDFWYYKFNSFYYEKIKAFKKEFSEVKILTTEDLNHNNTKIIKEVYEFLGVDMNFFPTNSETKYNQGGVFKKNIITNLVFEQSKFKSFVKKVIPITTKMKHLKLRIIKIFQVETPEIDEKTEDYLIDTFKEDVLSLKTDFGVNVSGWNKKFLE